MLPSVHPCSHHRSGCCSCVAWSALRWAAPPSRSRCMPSSAPAMGAAAGCCCCSRSGRWVRCAGVHTSCSGPLPHTQLDVWSCLLRLCCSSSCHPCRARPTHPLQLQAACWRRRWRGRCFQRWAGAGCWRCPPCPCCSSSPSSPGCPSRRTGWWLSGDMQKPKRCCSVWPQSMAARGRCACAWHPAAAVAARQQQHRQQPTSCCSRVAAGWPATLRAAAACGRAPQPSPRCLLMAPPRLGPASRCCRRRQAIQPTCSMSRPALAACRMMMHLCCGSGQLRDKVWAARRAACGAGWPSFLASSCGAAPCCCSSSGRSMR